MNNYTHIDPVYTQNIVALGVKLLKIYFEISHIPGKRTVSLTKGGFVQFSSMENSTSCCVSPLDDAY
jgi:hypothetical protein